MIVLVYRYVGEYGEGLVFAKITKKTFPNKQTPEEFYDTYKGMKKLGKFDLPKKFLDAIEFKKLEINLVYHE